MPDSVRSSSGTVLAVLRLISSAVMTCTPMGNCPPGLLNRVAVTTTGSPAVTGASAAALSKAAASSAATIPALYDIAFSLMTCPPHAVV